MEQSSTATSDNNSKKKTTKIPSLVHICRNTITSNLERFPPESFGICDPDEWEKIIQLRHVNTQPKNVKKYVASASASAGGLDGTGRLIPAVNEKFLHAVEDYNKHLSECPIADVLLWKDCVEYKFRRGGPSRPTGLLLPWPLLVEQVQKAANALLSEPSSDQITESIRILSETPMNVSLLKDSGAGKIVKKIIKKQQNIDEQTKIRLKEILDSWMQIAASSGVTDINTSPNNNKGASSTAAAADEYLDLAESCQTWRQLFATLKSKNEEIRSSQGKRMREIRKNLAKTRPKLVKVRPSKAAQQKMISLNSSSSQHENSKLHQLRQEATVQTSRQRSTPTKPKASFGDAVAFAAVTKKGMAHKRKKIGGTIQQLQGGKRMKIPDKVGQRQFASKWKK